MTTPTTAMAAGAGVPGPLKTLPEITEFSKVNDYIRNHSLKTSTHFIFNRTPKGMSKTAFELSHYLYSLNPAYKIEEDAVIDEAWIQRYFERTKALYEVGILTRENYKHIKTLLNHLAYEQALTCRIIRQKKIDASVRESVVGLYEFKNSLNPRIEGKHEREKELNRLKKKQFRISSLAISLVVGLGEGMVAAVFAKGAMMTLFGLGFAATIPIIAIPGFIVNLCLFYGSAVTTMKDLFMGRIYYDENGNYVSPTMRKAINTTLFLSVFSGLCFGALSFQSGTLAWAALLGASAASGGIVALAAIVAVVTTVALTCLYYVCAAKLLKNNTLSKIKDFFKETFTNVYAYDCAKDGGKDWTMWQDLSVFDKGLFYLKKTLGFMLNAVAVSAAIAVSFVFTGASFGMFANQAGGLVISAFKASAYTAKMVGYVTSAIGGILNTVFQVNSVTLFCTMLGKAALAATLLPFSTLGFAGKLIFSPKKTISQVKSTFKSIFNGHNKSNIITKTCRFIYRFILVGCTLINGAAQGMSGDNRTSIHAVSASTAGIVTGSLARDSAIAGMTSASNGANLEACDEVSRGPDSGIVASSKLKEKLDLFEGVFASSREHKVKKSIIGGTFYNVLLSNGGQLGPEKRALMSSDNPFSQAPRAASA